MHCMSRDTVECTRTVRSRAACLRCSGAVALRECEVAQSAGVLLKQLMPGAHRLSNVHAGAGERPPITCHVLDTATGTPAVGLRVILAKTEAGTRRAPAPALVPISS